MDSIDRIAADWEAQQLSPDRLDAFHVHGRIQHAARFYERLYERIATAHGMTAGDVYVLLALRRSSSPLTPTELVREVSVTSGAMTKRLDRLERLHLVRREPDPRDARSVKIALTAKGRRLVDEEISYATHAEIAAIGTLSSDERDALAALLRKLLAALESAPGAGVLEKGALRR